MTFQPVIPLSGYSGWLFLNRTADAQIEAFTRSAPIENATEAFRSRIGSIQSAEELVNDRALLSVALGAYGLDSDIDNKFFIKTILEEGTRDPDSLTNRLADTRYADLSSAFSFDNELRLNQFNFFSDDIIQRYEDRQFERAVGEQNNNLRLALNLAPSLNDVISNTQSNDGRWFAMMGNSPLRSVFQTAMGFPSSFATLDLDKQLEQFQDRAEKLFGTNKMEDLNALDQQEKIIRLFLLRSEAVASSATSTASVALALLQQT